MINMSIDFFCIPFSTKKIEAYTAHHNGIAIVRRSCQSVNKHVYKREHDNVISPSDTKWDKQMAQKEWNDVVDV